MTHSPLSPEQLQAVDGHILSCQMLSAITSIREYLGVGIKDAIDIHIDRYKKLRIACPAEFKCTDEEYWQETYS